MLNFVNRCQSTTLNMGLQDSGFFFTDPQQRTQLWLSILYCSGLTEQLVLDASVVFIKVHFSLCLLATEILRLMLGACKKTPELSSRYNLN